MYHSALITTATMHTDGKWFQITRVSQVLSNLKQSTFRERIVSGKNLKARSGASEIIKRMR